MERERGSVHVALKNSSDIMLTPGHTRLPVSEKDAIFWVPDSLYMFLILLFGGHTILEIETNVTNEDCVCLGIPSIDHSHLLYLGWKEVDPQAHNSS